MCFFHYKHEDKHKIIDVNEIKSLEDNGISYKETVSEFDKLFKKMNSLQTNIEYEIEKINKSRDTLLDEITKSFEKQRKVINRITYFSLLLAIISKFKKIPHSF